MVAYRDDGDWNIFVCDPFLGRLRNYDLDPAHIGSLFIDQLQNLNGYMYRVIYEDRFPFLWMNNGGVTGVEVAILNEIANHQNALLGFRHVPLDTHDFTVLDFVAYILRNRLVDIVILNIETDWERFPAYNRVFTYQAVEFCAMVPIPPRIAFLHIILMPFDAILWLSIVLLVVACTVTWKLLRKPSNNPDSSLYFAFGVIASSLGQAVPFRKLRRAQSVLLQLNFFFTFILSNVYVAMLFSAVASSRNGVRARTINEMLQVANITNAKYKITSRAYETFHVYGNDRRFPIDRFINPEEYVAKEWAANHIIVMDQCENIEKILEEGFKFAAEFYYIVPEKLHPVFNTYLVTQQSPFRKRLQLHLDHVFEAGLWQPKEMRKSLNTDREREKRYFENEEYFLNMRDVDGVFMVLLMGLALSIAAIAVEICVSKSCLNTMWRVDMKISVKCLQSKRRRGKVSPV